MQVNHRRLLHMVPELMILSVNGFVGFSFYVAEQMLAHSQYLKVNYTFACEKAFIVGAVALLVSLPLRRKLTPSILRLQLLVALIFFNQACLLGFLVSVFPHIL